MKTKVVHIGGEDFKIPVNWYLGYMVECTPTGYYWPPVTYYGPQETMWRVYDDYKLNILKFIQLGHLVPNKGNKMNAIIENDMVEAPFDLDDTVDEAAENNDGLYPIRENEKGAYVSEDEAIVPATIH